MRFEQLPTKDDSLFDLPSSEMPTVMSSCLLHGSLEGSRIFFYEDRISRGFPVVSSLERNSNAALKKSMPDSSFFTNCHYSGLVNKEVDSILSWYDKLGQKARLSVLETEDGHSP